MKEIWRDIKNFEAEYQISNLGRVKSLARKTKNQYGRKDLILQQINDKDGYKIVSFGGKLRKVHRLVAEAFISNPENKPQVNHKDCNKQNNCVDNLEWVTSQENVQHAYNNGLIKKHKSMGKKVIAENNEEILKFDSEIQLSKYLNVVPTAVSNCLKGRSKTCKGYNIYYDDLYVEYLPEKHLYLANGLYIIPSVTQLLQKLFPNKYQNVPKKVLERKSEYGTQIHKYIEQYEKGIITIKLNYIQEASFGQYLRLKDKYNINVLEQEKIVNYKDIYAGRFDMICDINGEHCLCDIKTTASLDKEYLSWQLSLYEYAYGKRFDKLYAIWLPKKDIGRLVEIERKTKKEINKLLEEINESRN